MVRQLSTNTTPAIVYPESDGQPIADNTKQFRLIVVIKENLELLFAANPDVFVAGDLLWYPVEGDNKIRSLELAQLREQERQRADDEAVIQLEQ